MDRQACHAQEKAMGDGAILECKYWAGRQTGDKCVHKKLTVDTAALQDLYINAVDRAKSLLLQCPRYDLESTVYIRLRLTEVHV